MISDVLSDKQDWAIVCGDSPEILRGMPDQCVQTVVTSPPYFGLRDYGLPPTTWPEVTYIPMVGLQPIAVPAQTCCLGLESTVEAYVGHLVLICREVYRVLRSDGTVWMNLGSCYAGSGGAHTKNQGNPGISKSFFRNGVPHFQDMDRDVVYTPPGFKPKDLIPIPWLVALALQADRWYLRTEIIWAKRNCLPESVTDRPTRNHEYIFLMAKSGKHTYWVHRDGRGSRAKPKPDYRWVNRISGHEINHKPIHRGKWRRINLWRGYDYFYDAEAIREERVTLEGRPDAIVRDREWGYDSKQAVLHHRNTGVGFGHGTDKEIRARDRVRGSAAVINNPPNSALRDSTSVPRIDSGRNRRTVWTIATSPFPGAHFATFPPALVEPCILAGSSPQACPVCGAPWQRVIDKTFVPQQDVKNPHSLLKASNKGMDTSNNWGETPRGTNAAITTGWQPTCSCLGNDGSGASVVLDPFSGAGTTVMVALRHGRKGIGFDLSPEYVKMSERRIVGDAPLFNGLASRTEDLFERSDLIEESTLER